ncbi:MAG: hypothetical protein JWM07_350 [Candidatus Saccharibacteria bacterium]|nr:hypothetical protein [Candidatus Saccharibacteria bacterium]
MNRVNVASSNLVSVGYDSLANLLEIEFKGGSLYVYSGVPSYIHSNLMDARSHGEYFASHIKNKYPTRRVM